MAREIEPVLVVGSGGMLGRAFTALLTREGVDFHAVDLPELDLSDAESIVRAVTPGTRSVLNCAAFTAVDDAETREAEATEINGEAVGRLAQRCLTLGATLAHYSTDYVFDGRADRPYAVDHEIAPVNAYGRSKARGEALLRRSGCEHLLIRTSWLYAPWGKNFVRTMADLTRERDTLRVVNDQVGRPSSAEYLAERSLALLRGENRGVFHLTDGGQCSWFELTRHIADRTGSSCGVDPCTSEEFKRPAPRPAYSVLDLSRAEALLGPSRPWRDNVDRVLQALSGEAATP